MAITSRGHIGHIKDELDYSHLSDEQRKQILEAMESFRPKFNCTKPILIGTGGDFEAGDPSVMFEPLSGDNKRTYSMESNTTNRELTHGEKATGVTLNPSRDPFVDEIKKDFAAIIDKLHAKREEVGRSEAGRYYSKAISYSEDAQMNAVKAITWQY